MVLTRLKQGVETKVIPYLPLVETKFNEVVAAMGVGASAVAGDDELIRRIFSRVHRQLPLPLRFAIKERPFVEFCMRNKRRFYRGDGQ